MSKTLPNFLDTAYGEKILPMRTLSQLSPSRSSGLLGTWLGEKLSPSLSVSPPLIWPTWWSQVEISHFYISQTISCYLSQIIDDSGHRHVQKAHVAKKITKEEWDLVSCSAARCRCVTASSPSRLNISKASPTKSRIRCCWSKMQHLTCSLKSSDIALSWKYNDFGSLPEELELYLDIIGKSRVLKPILFPWIFFVWAPR